MIETSASNLLQPEIDLSGVVGNVGSYPSLMVSDIAAAPDITTDDYALEQASGNERKTLNYLIPMVQAHNAKTVLDVGCGIGEMVRTFLNHGYSAYGVDLIGLHRHWKHIGLPTQRMFVIDPGVLRLPFHANSIDFIYTLGVIEHVGTSNGLSRRLPNYHAIREAWLRELYRVLKPGGSMLIAGPNRHFPFDTAHDLDWESTPLERWLSRRLKASVHRIHGEYFLWAYEDIGRYLHGLPHVVHPQSLKGFIEFSRVPSWFKPLTRAYVERMPRFLLGTGFNPWMIALVNKPVNASETV